MDNQTCTSGTGLWWIKQSHPCIPSVSDFQCEQDQSVQQINTWLRLWYAYTHSRYDACPALLMADLYEHSVHFFLDEHTCDCMSKWKQPTGGPQQSNHMQYISLPAVSWVEPQLTELVTQH